MSTNEIISAVERIVRQSEERLDAKIEGLRLEMLGHFDAVYQRLDRLEVEYQMITVALRRLEEAVSAGNEDRERLRSEVVELRQRVAELDARLREVEAKLSSS